MYCAHCQVHFSGTFGGGRCPYCGGEPSPSDAPGGAGKSGAPMARVSPSRSRRVNTGAETVSEPGPERGGSTVTESGSGDWTRGAIVAGKYEIVSRLGAGGFGTVYKVRHIYRKKYYALKTPHAEFVRDEAFRLRFEREIEAMERFVHPDAVMIRDSGITESETPYYTMDFIEGESLKVVLRREGRVPLERALRIIGRVLRVLDVAHAHQIIHRDIKPDNILLTCVSGEEAVKVLDFGVAKLLDLVGESGSVTKGMRVGTPKYMSPEQVLGEDLDPRSDLFSLGIVFYEMVTGEHPFACKGDRTRVTAAILSRTPRAPREVVPEIPRPISEQILWMLEKRARRRPDSARALLEQLGRVEGIERTAPLGALSVSRRVPRGPARTFVLRQETSVGERRVFLFFSEKVRFGRTNDPARGIRSDVIWRALPCRSRRADPVNWERNLTISQEAGRVYPEGMAVVIEPSPRGGQGVTIGGVRSPGAARILADRFHISLGEKALELDGHRRLRSRDRPELDLSVLDRGRPEDIPAATVGYSEPDGLIDHVRVRRASNWPLHEYFFVYRQVEIGASANAGLRLRGSGVRSVHAVLLFEKGEAFILPLQGTIGIGWSRRTFEVEPSALVPLRPGLEVSFGEALLRVEEAVDSHFKTV